MALPGLKGLTTRPHHQFAACRLNKHNLADKFPENAKFPIAQSKLKTDFVIIQKNLMLYVSLLVTECTIVMGMGKRVFSASPRLGFISPAIVLCETRKGSEFDWIKTTKRTDLVNFFFIVCKFINVLQVDTYN